MEFTMGVSKETTNPNDMKMALKIVVYGMDSLETAQTVFERISDTLLNLDPHLELAEIKGEKTAIN